MTPEEDGPALGEAPPLAIRATKAAAIQAALISVMIASATVVGAIGTVLSFWKARDLAGAIYWLRSSDALGAITAVMAIGGFGTIIVRSLQRKYREIFLARNTPDSIAYIVGEQLPPPPATRAQTGKTRLVDPAVLHRTAVMPDGNAVATYKAPEPATDPVIPGDALNIPPAHKG
jgi:hypothetical protein